MKRKEDKKKEIDVGKIQNVIQKKDRSKLYDKVQLFVSISLLFVAILQWTTYNKQAEIAENSNKLTQFQYRFEFYQKIEDLQKEVSIIEKDPQMELEEFSELNYRILALYRESILLFDESTAKEINDILDSHMEFLMDLNNNGMYFDTYKDNMNSLSTEYGKFLNSERFKHYIDINEIQ